MSLAGSVETFPLQAVIGLLESTGARGVLHLRHRDGEAALHVEGGSLVGWEGADSDDATEVVADLLDATDAHFEWEVTDPDIGRVPVGLAEVVAGASARHAERCEMRAVVPSPEHRLELVAGHADEIVLPRGTWPLVCAIGAGRPAAEVMAAVAGDPLTAHRDLGALVGAGLVRVLAPAAPAAAAPLATAEIEVAPAPAGAGTGDDPADVVEAQRSPEAQEALLEGLPLPPLPTSHPSAAIAGSDPDELAEALVDRGPWPTEQLRDLVEQAKRETDAVLAEADEAARAVGRSLAAPEPPPAEEDEAAPVLPAGPLAGAERSTLLRFFSSARSA